MDIRLYHQKRDEELSQTVGIVNPTSYDFTCKYDVNENGKPEKFTIKSRQGLMLKRNIADHISERLCDKILLSHKGMVTPQVREDTLKTIRLYE